MALGTGTLRLSGNEFDSFTYDACGPITWSVNASYFDCSTLGTHALLLIGRDAAGNAANTTVTLNVLNNNCNVDCLVSAFNATYYPACVGCYPTAVEPQDRKITRQQQYGGHACPALTTSVPCQVRVCLECVLGGSWVCLDIIYRQMTSNGNKSHAVVRHKHRSN